jgi:hypothetical protein
MFVGGRLTSFHVAVAGTRVVEGHLVGLGERLEQHLAGVPVDAERRLAGVAGQLAGAT